MSYRSFESILQTIRDNQVAEVSLSHRGIDDSACAELADAIAGATVLSVLDLQGNTLTSAGVATLCNALRSNRTIVEVGLASNAIDDEGARRVLDVLNVNPVLKAVDLHGNGIDKQLLQEIEFRCNINTQPSKFKEAVPALLAGEVVEHLDLSNPGNTTMSFPLLSTILSRNESVTSLDLTSVGLGDMGADIIGAMLKEKKGLLSLTLDKNGISLHGIRNLAQSGLKQNQSVEGLSLRGNKVGDDAARLLVSMLRENDTITELDVSENAVSQGALESLAYALHLNQQPLELKKARQAVELQDPNTTEVSFPWIPNMGLCAYFLAPVLKNSQFVTLINFSNARIGDAGAFDIASVIKVNKSIRVVELANNDITSEGAMALAGSLATNTTMTELNLANNEVGNEGIAAFATALQTNDTLTVMNAELNPCSDELFDELEGLLLVNAQPLALKQMLPRLESNDEELTVVDFSQFDGHRFFNDASALVLSRGLRNNQFVTQVDLSGNSISDSGAAHIAEVLARNSTIKSINLANNSIGERGGMALADALKENQSVVHISLKGNSCGEETAEHVVSMLNVNHSCNLFDMEGCRVSKAVLNELRIAGAMNLQPISLKQLLPSLRSSDPELLDLKLQGDDDDKTMRLYDDTATAFLMTELADNEHVLTMDLSDNKVGPEGCVAIAEWLSKPTTKLEELRLYGNPIGDEGLIALSGAFEKNATLKVVDIRATGISDEGVQAVAKSLEKNDSIKSILISKGDANISAAAAAVLTRELAINGQPLSLKRALPPLIANDPTATSVYLPRDETRVLDDLSCQLLSHALAGNTHVQSLDLSGNEITSAGVEYLSDMLEDATTISEVHLEDNHIDDTGATMLIQTLTANYTIRYLGLQGNPVNENQLREIDYLMRVNNAPRCLKDVLVPIASNDGSATYLDFNGDTANQKFTDDAVRILCSLLVDNTCVTHVNLGNNNLTDIGASYLADLLRVNSTLAHLDLYNNEIGEDGADMLFQALKANSTLVNLGLGKNPIPKKAEVFELLQGVLTVNAMPLKFPKKKRGEFKPKVEDVDDATMFKDTEWHQDVDDQVWNDGMVHCPTQYAARTGVRAIEQ